MDSQAPGSNPDAAPSQEACQTPTCLKHNKFQEEKNKNPTISNCVRQRSFRITDECPRSWQHRYGTCHVCSSHHKSGRWQTGNLPNRAGTLPRTRQRTLRVPRAISNPTCERKYWEKLEGILGVRILISINQLTATLLFLLGRDTCWFLVNSGLTLVNSLLDKHELWQTSMLPSPLPRSSKVTCRKKMDAPWVRTCWIQLVSIQDYNSYNDNIFLDSYQSHFSLPSVLPWKAEGGDSEKWVWLCKGTHAGFPAL